MSKYSSANKKVFERVLAKKKAEIETTLMEVVDNSSTSVMADIQRWTSDYFLDCLGSPYLPLYSGALYLSTGIGVYNKSVLTRYNPNQAAFLGIQRFPQRTLRTMTRNIIGARYLSQALSAGSAQFGKNLTMAVMATVPYAKWVNEGDGDYNPPKSERSNPRYWDRIVDSTKSIVRTNVKISFPKNYQ